MFEMAFGNSPSAMQCHHCQLDWREQRSQLTQAVREVVGHQTNAGHMHQKAPEGLGKTTYAKNGSSGIDFEVDRAVSHVQAWFKCERETVLKGEPSQLYQ